jgi:hypothetical protein
MFPSLIYILILIILTAPNAIADLKAKLKSFLSRKKTKKEGKPTETATTAPAATTTAPAEPVPATAGKSSTYMSI